MFGPIQILLGLIFMTTGAIAFFLYRHLRRSQESLRKLDDHAAGLTQKLTEHEKAIHQMPASFNGVITNELRSGLHDTVRSVAGLKDELGQTHLAFQQMANNIPHLDTMPEWLSDVKSAIQPLQTAAHGLNSLDDKIIERFNTFMSGRDKMEKTFDEVMHLIQEWTEASVVDRQEFKRLVGGHLTSLAEQTHKMKEAMADLQLFAKTNDGLINSMKNDIPDTLSGLKNLTRQVTDFTEDARQNALKMTRLIEVWEHKSKNQQWLLWVGYGLMTLNMICLAAFLLFK